MSSDLSISVRFHAPPEDLRRYFTTFYITEFELTEGQTVSDSLQPEWANLRIFNGVQPRSWLNGEARQTWSSFPVTGPSVRSINFEIGTCRMWGIGLLPLGWARFVGHPAADHANLVADGWSHPSFAHFVPLAEGVFGDEPDETGELQRIIDFFRALKGKTDADEARIVDIHGAMVDPALATVSELVERVGASQRTIERIAQRAFGFSPKVLLRRQRFMRSLAQFMLDPSLKWIGAIDSHYHDQAQFVRDFREFMGMTPREYASMPHPVLEMFMRERARVHGAPVQTMDRPEGTNGAKR